MTIARMIGNKGAIGLLGLIIIIIMLILGIIAGMLAYQEIKYSWKMKKIIDEHNATCYLERGFLRFPLAEICTWNNTLHIKRIRIGPNQQTTKTYLEALKR